MIVKTVYEWGWGNLLIRLKAEVEALIILLSTLPNTAAKLSWFRSLGFPIRRKQIVKVKVAFYAGGIALLLANYDKIVLVFPNYATFF